jgi:hypothetical protein
MRGFITTDDTLKRDLRASMAAHTAIATVGDFLNALMAVHGLTLDTPLASIEFGVAATGNGKLTIDETDAGVEIREGRR